MDQKASSFYTDNLSPKLQLTLIDHHDSLPALRTALIKEFGSASRIIGDIVSSLRSKKKPTNRTEQKSYFALIVAGLSRIDKLERCPFMN